MHRPTCGEGLAEHSVLPAMLGDLMGALAKNLEVHMRALDGGDEHARAEHHAYERLAAEVRRTADRLHATAREMAGYRSLPMGKHDDRRMHAPEVRGAFEAFVRLERSLASYLGVALERHGKMLTL